jgi:hypothetical protein
MNSIKGFILLILLSYSSVLYSQGRFQEGYIIINDGTVLYGLVKDRKEAPFAKIHSKVRFRKNSLITRRYGPGKIIGYKSGDRTYESLWFDSRNRFLKTSYLSKPGYGKKVFLRVDYKGNLTLYQLEWVDQESGLFDEFPLFKRQNDDYFIRVTQGILGLRKNDLIEYFSDCRELRILIDNAGIKNPEEIARFYNDNCGK